MTTQISIGQTVFSADTSTHGCREGWVARVVAVDGDMVTAVVTSNTHCYGCWQTGCVDDDAKHDNDMIGRVVTFDATWAITDDMGDVYARNWTFSTSKIDVLCQLGNRAKDLGDYAVANAAIAACLEILAQGGERDVGHEIVIEDGCGDSTYYDLIGIESDTGGYLCIPWPLLAMRSDQFAEKFFIEEDENFPDWKPNASKLAVQFGIPVSVRSKLQHKRPRPVPSAEASAALLDELNAVGAPLDAAQRWLS